MSSDSDDYSITSAAKTRRYRQRRQAGIAPRHMATPDEQRQLLSLPYNTLTPKQKSRVRQYRRRNRNQQQHEQPLQSQSDTHTEQQAQLVASRFNDPYHTLTTSSVTIPSMDMMSFSHHPSTGITPVPSQ